MPGMEGLSAAKKELTNLDETGKKAGDELRESKNGERISEVSKNPLEKTDSGVLDKLDEIKDLTPEQLNERMNELLSKKEVQDATDSDEGIRRGLTDIEKQRIKDETGWSDKIIESIGSIKEYEIYKKADLVEANINGRECLIRNDIDWDQKDQLGRTNRERVEREMSPINKNGEKIELHHIGQHDDSPLAELTFHEHHGKENFSVLHDFTKPSEINRPEFTNDRPKYWATRYRESGGNN